MTNAIINTAGGPVSVKASAFHTQSGPSEYHLVVRPLAWAPFEAQMESLQEAYRQALESLGLPGDSAVFRRFFCSDLRNQAALLRRHPLSAPNNPDDLCAVSWVGQPPAGRRKVSLWACHIQDPAGPLDKSLDGRTLTLRRGAAAHHWTTQLWGTDGQSSYTQTREVFETYLSILASRDMTLADHVLRTWLFVEGVDSNYAGMVTARRQLFEKHGLTAQTHYIASTGIEGTSPGRGANVGMDAYAVSGIRPGQVEYLCVPDHMCPTSLYGVTFERATCLSWQDRGHIFISGTASIDREGRILHEGDIHRQFDRTFENVAALLKKKNARLEDLQILLVYVRDPADRQVVQSRLRKEFGPVPSEVLLSPVCRPGWLIEAEGMAIIKTDRPDLPAF